MKRIAFILFWVCVVIPLNSFPTCIQIYRAADGAVYIAADSKRQVTSITANKYKSKYIQACKIESRRGLYFCVAGHMDTFIYETLERQCKWFKNIKDIEKHATDTIVMGLQQNAEREKVENIQDYQLNLKLGLFSQVGLVYFDKTPIIDGIFFQLTEVNSKPVVKALFQLNSPGLSLGISDHLSPTNPEYRQLFFSDTSNPVKLVKDIIKYEMKFHEQSIGNPIDVIKLTTTGRFIPLTRTKNCDSLRSLYPNLFRWFNDDGPLLNGDSIYSKN